MGFEVNLPRSRRYPQSRSNSDECELTISEQLAHCFFGQAHPTGELAGCLQF